MSETLISRNPNISDKFSFDDVNFNGATPNLLDLDDIGIVKNSSATSSGASLYDSNKSGNELINIDDEVDDENNNVIGKQGHFDRERVLSDNSNDEDTNAMLFSDSSQDDMLKQLFDFYDIEKTGFIKVDHFLDITKQNMADQWKSNEKRITDLVNQLDPFERGLIDFEQFKTGISQITQDQSLVPTSPETDNHVPVSGAEEDPSLSSLVSSNPNNNFDPIYRKSNDSPVSSSNETFNEYDTDSQLNHLNRKTFSETMNSGLTEDLMIKIQDEQMSQSNSTQNNSNGSGSYKDHTSSSQFDIASFDENTNNLNAIDEASGDLLEVTQFDSKSGQPNRASSLLTTSSSSSLIKSSTMNKLSGDVNNGQQEEDLFGIDMETINNHKRNLASNNSAYNLSSSNEDEHEEANDRFRLTSEGDQVQPNLNSRRSIVSSKRRASELYNQTKNQSFSTSNEEFISNDDGQGRRKSSIIDEELVESYEKKINELKQSNDELTSEKEDMISKLNKLSNENAHLVDKIREIEEHNQDMDRKYQAKILSESQAHQDQINRLKSTHLEENDNLRAQVNTLENQLNHYKLENTKHLKEINEITKKINLTDVKLNEETEKYKQLREEFQRILKEKEAVKESYETMKFQYSEKMEVLKKELDESILKNQQLNEARRRTNTLLEENSLVTQVKDLEQELKQANAHISELNAQILKSNFDNGRRLLTLTASSGPSFAAEIDTMSKDDLMNKLQNEQQITQRLRDYIDSMLSKIMEHSPEILEVTMMAANAAAAKSSLKSNSAPTNTTPRRGSQQGGGFLSSFAKF